MSDKIKPSEVSQVLLEQLKGLNNGNKFDEVGTVLEVSDGVARIYGLRNAEANELLEFENGTMAIVMNLEEDNVGCVLLGSTDGIKEGMVVKRTKRIASINVNDNMLGRVINPLGQAIDGKGEIDLTDSFEMPLDRKAPGVIYRQPVKEPLQTGLKSVDSMIPIGRGQRELIIGDRQTGKTAIAVDTIINQKSFYEAGKPVYCIYVAIGQKASTVAALVENLKQHGAMPYGTDNIGGYGCGPTSMAIVVSSLTDDTVDPVEMAQWSYENGYWCDNSGSYHALIPAAAEAWGLPVSGCTTSEPQRIVDALSEGKLVVAIMAEGHFTSSGHFIVLRGVKDGQIMVADPASYKRSEQLWDLSIILNEASRRAGAGGPFWIIG